MASFSLLVPAEGSLGCAVVMRRGVGLVGRHGERARHENRRADDGKGEVEEHTLSEGVRDVPVGKEKRAVGCEASGQLRCERSAMKQAGYE